MTAMFDIGIVGAGIAANALLEEIVRVPGIRIAVFYGGSETERVDSKDTVTENHHPLRECSNAVFGGTSKTWGGRCVDYDDIDFIDRSYINAKWPITKSDLKPFYSKACEFLEIGNPEFSAVRESACTVQEHGFTTTKLERWSLPLRIQSRMKAIGKWENVTLIGGFHVARIESVSDGYRLISSKESQSAIVCKICVVAAGGLGSTKLAINSMRNEAFPLLGKCYQGHLSGKIANIIFNQPASVDYGFRKDGEVYTRWRFQPTAKHVLDNKLLNCALWVDNLPLYDHKHGNAILSFVYLLFSVPILSRFLAPPSIRKALLGAQKCLYKAHIRNVFTGFPSVIFFAVPFFFKRYVFRRKIPGFFLFSPGGKYALHFHSEQEPRLDNEIIKNEKDYFEIKYSFSDTDCESVLRTHKLLEKYLVELGIGRLEYFSDDEKELKNLMKKKCQDGIHQIGTTRMAESKKDGFVDSDLQVFGYDGLYVLSSAVFPTSSQANPTFLLVVLAKRLGALLSAKVMSGENVY
ncbi:GMC family oxidoreductase [Pseudomaricurvus alcaniphilus]|uniref:GMC family oxidoreductase n=1 Tax=Pseudomaricurvus alcaniphilus TaxID=1166482 RepID=UPI00140BA871|nr:GMC oxidoreductase [Pseudomaricurvus alcaniphilus]NHN39582.1 GMC family oxidoreductase [Pseudomaricurvus alcaniphilus]